MKTTFPCNLVLFKLYYKTDSLATHLQKPFPGGEVQE